MATNASRGGKGEVTDVRLVGVAIPFMDLVGLVFQLWFATLLAGTLLSIPLALIYAFLQAARVTP